MDKYMKFIFTIIAVEIIGINFQLFKGNIITKVNAGMLTDIKKIQICDMFSCSSLSNGRLIVANTDY